MKGLVECLRKEIGEIEFCPIGDLYLFGSALRIPTYRDLDLLLIIDPGVVSIRAAYALASPMLQAIEGALAVHVDLTLLSKGEEARENFANLVRAELVTPAWMDNKRIEPDSSNRCAPVPAARAGP